MHTIPEKTFIHPNVTIQPSTIGGVGLFATEPIAKGELVVLWGGGAVVTEEEFQEGFVKGIYQPESAIHFDAAHKWVSLSSDPDYADTAINHSCDPTLWFEGGWPLVARRDISTGEEITFDYATGETYPLQSPCACGANSCRKEVTGNEWMNPEFQKKYRGHMNPYIQELLDSQPN
jgi:SET domain-containing protein